MPTVLNEYVGDGVSKSFNISMEGGYLSRDYVKFYVRPLEALLDWTPLTNNTVTWTGDFSFTLAEAIPTGSVLVVFRETPLAPMVNFQNTSRITEKNLDTGITQPLHKVAELTDLVDRGVALSEIASNTSYEALGIAEAAQSAAAGAVADALTAVATANGATATANSALAASSSATTTANSAALQAAQADSKATSALAAANTAVSTANTAYGNATIAVNTANAAQAASASATDTANTALAASNTASTSATQAQNAAAAAANSAEQAELSAAAASVSADNAAALAGAADANATEALSTANTAMTTANAAASQASDADTKATTALAQSNTALSNSSTALSTAQYANATANDAMAAAANALELVEDAVSGTVTSFNGRDGAIVPQAGDYDKSMVGLGNVDNTSDLDKPVSTAVAAALELKANASDVASALELKANQDALTSGLSSNSLEDRKRVNHTGTQPISTVAGLQLALDSKFNGSIFIPEASDLNNYMAPGVYHWHLGTINAPTAYGSMLVTAWNGSGTETCEQTVFKNGNVWVRGKYNSNTAWTNWRSLAHDDEVAPAIAMAGTFSYVPTTFQAWNIIVTQPHLRVMMWNGTKYIRAPWHAPGQLSYFLRNVPAGYIEVRSDVVLNRADFPDLAEYLGVTGATFTLDETRGEFLRALDSGRGKDAGRVVGSHQGDAGRNLTGAAYLTGTGRWNGRVMSTFTSSDGALRPTVTATDAAGIASESITVVSNTSWGLTLDASLQWPTADEFRVSNLAYRLAVQY